MFSSCATGQSVRLLQRSNVLIQGVGRSWLQGRGQQTAHVHRPYTRSLHQPLSRVRPPHLPSNKTLWHSFLYLTYSRFSATLGFWGVSFLSLSLSVSLSLSLSYNPCKIKFLSKFEFSLSLSVCLCLSLSPPPPPPQ